MTGTTSAHPVPRPPLRLGLTGGIGSGKSTVATLLQGLGATVIDADAVSRAATASSGSAIGALRAHFGSDFITPDGALDRNRMRAHVFARPEARQALEAIVHPIVRADIERQYQATTTDCAVFDIPLLVESPGWRERLDTIWVVDCQPETQVRRVMQRNGWPREQVEAVLTAQATRAQRLAVADTVIDNDAVTLDDLSRAVTQAYSELRHRFGL